MLVLSRKVNESIRIGDTILITVVQVRGDKVRLGIEAPVEIPVVRTELEPKTQESSSVSSLAARGAVAGGEGPHPAG